MLDTTPTDHSNTLNTQQFVLGAFMVLAGSAIIARLLPSSMRASLIDFTVKIQSLAPDLTRLPTYQEKPRKVDSHLSGGVVLSPPTTGSDPCPQREDVSFTVQASMLEALHVLGLDVQINQTFSINRLKATYKKRCLETHPDKTNQQNHTAFIDINHAYRTILELIEKDVLFDSPIETTSTHFSQMRAEVSELERNQRFFKKELSELNQENGAIRAGIKELNTGIDRLDKNIKIFDEKSAAFDEKSAAFDQKSAAFDQRSAAFDQRSAAFNQRSAAFDQRSAAFDQRSAAFDEELACQNRVLQELSQLMDKHILLKAKSQLASEDNPRGPLNPQRLFALSPNNLPAPLDVVEKTEEPLESTSEQRIGLQ